MATVETGVTDVLMTSGQVAECLAVSVRTLWRWVADGTFPPPVRYNRKLVRWRRSDLGRWIDSQTPGRSGGKAVAR